MKIVMLIVAAVAVLGGVWVYTHSAESAFHLMRVYGVMGGAQGNSNIQYVELRMSDPGQSIVNGHHICFYDAAGNAWARFRFPSSVANGSDESSILIGTAEFNAAWAGGTADFTFAAANTVAINGSADVDHPVVPGAGKVAFGTDGATMTSLMCQGSFSLIDSVAYGAGYTGGVDYPPAFGSDLPTSATQTLELQVSPICHPASFSSPCVPAPNNSNDYALVDANMAGNQPRNNAGSTGPIGTDADGDGYTNTAESGEPLCAGSANDDNADDALVNDGCSAVGPAEVNCADNVDDDGDTLVNDGCPQAGSFSEGSFAIGTNAAGPCSEGVEAGPSPSWPSDLISGSIPNSTDKVTIGDLSSFVAPPPRRLGTAPGAAGFDSRWDLVPSMQLGGAWINVLDLSALVSGSSGNPPMFGGARAFNGPLCTGP